ncbi:hypothetical protein [Motilimonas sp. E26]|uniref:hypothetical protein n=2 Tax=unclassified Motilimonas TaxID=2643697 RepID=UPI001E2BB50C|nr:hypothetical protein [Motilimonas sp. E26]MCE0556107.1 hypothetical protein [Motilimonas sp. E26]
MNVNQTNRLGAIYTQLASQQSAPQPKTYHGAKLEDTVTISETGKRAQQNWQDIASKYDVHNISAQEVSAMSRELFEGGFINSGQMMAIGAPTSMVESPFKKYDLLNDMKQTFSLSASLGSQTNAAKTDYLNAISTLERLNEYR